MYANCYMVVQETEKAGEQATGMYGIGEAYVYICMVVVRDRRNREREGGR